jgi:hypothetical protein
VRTSDKPKDILRFDLENETTRQYRDRVRQYEALGKFAIAEQIRLLATNADLQGPRRANILLDVMAST